MRNILAHRITLHSEKGDELIAINAMVEGMGKGYDNAIRYTLEDIDNAIKDLISMENEVSVISLTIQNSSRYQPGCTFLAPKDVTWKYIPSGQKFQSQAFLRALQ
jgi:hypothetical protein